MPSRDDIVAALRKADANGDTQAAQRFASMLGAPDPDAGARANAAGIQAGRDQSDLGAAINQAAQQGTAGLSNYINAGARYAGQRLTGVQNPDSYDTDLAYSRGISQGNVDAHPISSTIGGAGGVLLGGESIGSAARGVRALRGANAAVQTPGLIARAVNGAVTGGALGATQAAAQGQDPTTIAQNAVGGTLTGGTIAGIAPAIGQRLAPAAQKAWDLLASKLKVSTDDLMSALNSHQLLTGAVPSMAQITQYAQQGVLRHLASVNPELGAAARVAADQGGAPLHVQLQAAQAANASRPQTTLGLTAARNAQMNNMMGAPNASGTPLRAAPVADPNGVLNAPHVDFAMRPNTTVNARLNQASPVLDRIQNQQTTVGDVDTIRRALRDQQQSFLRDAPGGLHAKDPTIANEFGDLATQVEGVGRGATYDPATKKWTPNPGQLPQHVAYGNALDRYRELSNYTTGFEHGRSGGDFNAPNSSDVADALGTPAGNAGYQHGNALSTAQSALDAIAPGGAQPPSSGIRAAAHTAAAIGSGGLSTKLYHGLAALAGDKIPAAQQQIIANYLFDPSKVQQGIALLRRAKIRNEAISDFASGIGGTVGASITNNLLNTRTPAP